MNFWKNKSPHPKGRGFCEAVILVLKINLKNYG
jgi:hypothetical protein